MMLQVAQTRIHGAEMKTVWVVVFSAAPRNPLHCSCSCPGLRRGGCDQTQLLTCDTGSEHCGALLGLKQS